MVVVVVVVVVEEKYLWYCESDGVDEAVRDHEFHRDVSKSLHFRDCHFSQEVVEVDEVDVMFVVDSVVLE